MDKRSEQISHQRRYTDDKYPCEKTFHIICHQGNATMRYYYTPMRMINSKTLTAPNSGKGLSFIAGENAKWYRHLGRQFDRFLQN